MSGKAGKRASIFTFPSFTLVPKKNNLSFQLCSARMLWIGVMWLQLYLALCSRCLCRPFLKLSKFCASIKAFIKEFHKATVRISTSFVCQYKLGCCWLLCLINPHRVFEKYYLCRASNNICSQSWFKTMFVSGKDLLLFWGVVFVAEGVVLVVSFSLQAPGTTV